MDPQLYHSQHQSVPYRHFAVYRTIKLWYSAQGKLMNMTKKEKKDIKKKTLGKQKSLRYSVSV